MGEIPDHIAAYAAALYDAGVGTWADVTAAVAGVGLGSYRYDRLARAATTWAAANVSPSARAQLRARRKQAATWRDAARARLKKGPPGEPS